MKKFFLFYAVYNVGVAAALIFAGIKVFLLTQRGDNLPFWEGIVLALVSAFIVLSGFWALAADTQKVARWVARVLLTLAVGLSLYFLWHVLFGEWRKALWGLLYIPTTILWMVVLYTAELLEPEEKFLPEKKDIKAP